MRFLASIILTLSLIFGFNAPMVYANASAQTNHTQIDSVSDDRKDPRARGKGKKKGLHKRTNKFSSDFSTFSFRASTITSSSDVVEKPGKCKSKKNCKAAKKATKKRAGKKGIGRSRSGGGTGTPSTANNRPTVVRPDLTVTCGGKKYDAGQGRVICVTIEQPVETRVEYKTRTVTDRVVYGAGILALAAVAAGLIALFLGFILGWRRAGKNEDEFISSVLHDDTKEN